MKLLILSRSRSNSISTHKLFPNATLVCPESQVNDYKHCNLDIHPTPDSLIGLGRLRNYCLDNFKDDIVMLDDDIEYCAFLGDCSPRRINDLDAISQVISNAYQNALDANCKCFSFNQAFSVIKYRPNEPFILNSWVGMVVGIIQKDNPIRFTEVTKSKVDIDYSLEQLKLFRKVWIDNRFAFVAKRDSNTGGSSILRSQDSVLNDMQFLKRKWGKYVTIYQSKSKERIKINVQRKQPVSL